MNAPTPGAIRARLVEARERALSIAEDLAVQRRDAERRMAEAEAELARLAPLDGFARWAASDAETRIAAHDAAHP